MTTFEVTVEKEKTGAIPSVDSTNIYSHARNVNSNIVSAGSELEKFIFYRGLGRYQPRFQVSSKMGDVVIKSTDKTDPKAALLIDVDQNGHARAYALDQFRSTVRMDSNGNAIEFSYRVDSHSMHHLREHSQSTVKILEAAGIRSHLISALIKEGLYKDEAEAMLDTWENGYFKVPGLRVLAILPRAEVDEILPLTMSPSPTKLERVFVSRVEVLTDHDENQILANVEKGKTAFKVETLGRFAEPMLRRASQLYQGSDLEVNKAFQELISRAALMNTLGTATLGQ